MDTSEIADAAGAAATTVGTLVACALAGTVLSLCATTGEEDASGNVGASTQQWFASTSGVQNATATDTGTAAETASAGTSPACISPVVAGACTGTHIADSGGDVRAHGAGKRSRKQEVPKDVMHRRIKEWGLQKPQHSKNPVWKWARKYRNPPLSGLHVGFYDTGFRI